MQFHCVESGALPAFASGRDVNHLPDPREVPREVGRSAREDRELLRLAERRSPVSDSVRNGVPIQGSRPPFSSCLTSQCQNVHWHMYISRKFAMTPTALRRNLF